MTETLRAIDLNADLGEGFPWDRELLARVSSASICCGAHAGDRDTARTTLAEARDRRVVVGAHPGYADRAGFGRRDQSMTAREVEQLIRDQVGTLAEIAAETGVSIRFLKPHGALYNQAQRDEEIATGVMEAARALGLLVLGQPDSWVEELAVKASLPFVVEGFADRRYQDDGRLVPRSQAGAILDDPAEIEAQAIRLIGQGVQTLCIHGDDPRSVWLADLVRGALDRQGVALRSFVGR